MKKDDDKMDSEATQLVNGKNLCEGVNQYTMLGRGRHPLYELAQEYLKQNKKAKLHPEKNLIKDHLDLSHRFTARIDFCEKSLDPKIVCRHLPKPVLRALLKDSLEIKFEDGLGSAYDALAKKMGVKGTPDFYHEIGHHYWNCALIPKEEEEQRQAVIHSMTKGKTERKTLEERLIPSTHKRYALLVGAHSGQFLWPKNTASHRLNDLDEQFARNFDYLIRGQPMEVLEASKAKLKDMLDFFEDEGIIDKEFKDFYIRHMKENYRGTEFIRISKPEDIWDGVFSKQAKRGEQYPISMREIADLHIFKERIKKYSELVKDWGLPNLPIEQETAIRLDITPEFAQYCLEKDKAKVIEALKYTRTATNKLQRKIEKFPNLYK